MFIQPTPARAAAAAAAAAGTLTALMLSAGGGGGNDGGSPVAVQPLAQACPAFKPPPCPTAPS